MSTWLVDKVSGLLEARTDRRGFLARSAMVGSAVTVAPTSFILKPGTAYGAICNCNGSLCNCGDLCCDGYTEFCCTIYGENRCPPGTAVAGWWKADGSPYCHVGGVAQPRYYLDCNALCGNCAPASDGFCSGACFGCGCGCAKGRCDHRKACCTRFRYGQCNQQIPHLGPIVCRLVTCNPPWTWEETCTTTSATDNYTALHNRPCLQESDPADPPEEQEMRRVCDLPLSGDWNGDGSFGIVAVRGRTWYLRQSPGSGSADRSFVFGKTGDIPVVGDWDGDGVWGIGVVRGNRWYLRNTPNSGPADHSFTFGKSGDIPVTGDWDGDGRTGIGVVRGRNWYLRNTPSSGVADKSFVYGKSGDIPVTGDWDGDGRTGIGVVRDRTWYLRNTAGSGPAEYDFTYGWEGDVPVTGDWNGDGRTGIGVVRRRTWFLRQSPTGGSASLEFNYGDCRMVPA